MDNNMKSVGSIFKLGKATYQYVDQDTEGLDFFEPVLYQLKVDPFENYFWEISQKGEKGILAFLLRLNPQCERDVHAYLTNVLTKLLEKD